MSLKHAAPAPATKPHPRPSHARMITAALIGLGAALAALLAVQATGGYGQGLRPIRAFTAADDCTAQPRFIDPLLAQAHGDGLLSAEVDVHLSTSEPSAMGLVLVVSDLQARRQFLYRDQGATWDDAGYLGPFVKDEEGSIYTAPVPRVSLADNPPARATTIWRVDTDSQVMAPWVTLPAAAAPSTRNPFGLLGLAYDCARGSVYAASVAGSTPRDEVGQVVRIERASAAVSPVVSGVDALSVAVLRGGGRSWLYLGSAREGVVRAYELGADGAVAGEPRDVVSLRREGAGADDRARRVVLEDGELFVFASPFTFALRATGEREETIYRFTWDVAAQAWVFAERRERAP